MYRQGFVVLFCILNAITIFAATLDQVLRSPEVQATSFADFISLPPVLEILPTDRNLVIFAPTNAAMQQYLAGNNSSVSRRQNPTQRDLDDQKKAQKIAMRQASAGKRDLTPGGDVLQTYVANTPRINLGAGVPMSLVQKPGSVPDRQVVFSGLARSSNVISGDFPFDQGVVRLVDSIFTLPESGSQSGSGSTFVELIERLNLTEILNESVGVTVLLPTEDAFMKAKPWLDTLADEQLREVLLYHVLSNFVGYSPYLGHLTWHQTLEGSYVFTKIYDNRIYMNDGLLIAGDSVVTNGVAHVIDKVLIPPAYDWIRAKWRNGHYRRT